MELDFKGLDDLSGAAQDFKPEPAPATHLEREARQIAEDRSKAAAVYREYQENIKKTELLQAEILKGVKAHEDIYVLFLKACKALGLTISNREFFPQIEKELPIYYPESEHQ